MATTGRMDLRGLGNYLEELARAGQDVDEAADRALEVGATPIVQEMRALVPKDTRNLEFHIKFDGPYREGNYHFVDIGVITDDKETAIYGNVQEYGSSSVQAQPYIRPSFQGKKGAAMRAMKASLQSEGLL
jgi:HK97 gp10 family phage protein